ncbi:hypothetical protein Taro_040270 [Colocasia esculenta]|uniref:Retrotransposon gag domain-containing protein n=1 Tax=Colocasia esculenta TaxID=4460 RepID=A0A843WPU0_COLES|nr:hypothetical protein [Colocasia esculenta]
MARNQWRAMQETVAGLTQALENVVQAGNQAAAARNKAGFLEMFCGKYFSERVKEKKAAEFAALKQKGMFMAEYEAQFARLAVYAPHLVGKERLKANRFMDGLRPMFIEKLGPHNIQTYT